jgi:hypothetical protein
MLSRSLIAYVSAMLLLLLAGCSVLEAVEPDPCINHYVMCQESGLGLIDDGQWSRCQTCMYICQSNDGAWPNRTPAGGDCRYWMYGWLPASVDGGIDVDL